MLRNFQPSPLVLFKIYVNQISFLNVNYDDLPKVEIQTNNTVRMIRLLRVEPSPLIRERMRSLYRVAREVKHRSIIRPPVARHRDIYFTNVVTDERAIETACARRGAALVLAFTICKSRRGHYGTHDPHAFSPSPLFSLTDSASGRPPELDP